MKIIHDVLCPKCKSKETSVQYIAKCWFSVDKYGYPVGVEWDNETVEINVVVCDKCDTTFFQRDGVLVDQDDENNQYEIEKINKYEEIKQAFARIFDERK